MHAWLPGPGPRQDGSRALAYTVPEVLRRDAGCMSFGILCTAQEPKARMAWGRVSQ